MRLQRVLDVAFIQPLDDGSMTIQVEHRIQMAVDCECGTSIEACDEEELFDELLEHISAAHDSVLRREPKVILSEAYGGSRR